MQCSIPNHKEIISFACFDELCSEFRLGCIQCIKNNFHFQHINNLKQIPDLISVLSDTSKKCNEFINQLNILNGRINEMLIIQIRQQKWSFQSQMNTHQLNNIITKLIKFNSENEPLIQQASQQTEKLIKCLTHFLQTISIPQEHQQSEYQFNTNIKNSEMSLFKYQVINSIKESDYCFSVCFNQDSTIMIAGYMDGIIKVFEFSQGNIKLIQRLNQHQGIVGCLNYMNKSNSFVSGSLDNIVIIWRICDNKQWYVQQKLTGHHNWIRCILINLDDDLIVSGSRDKSIKFWRKENSWQCSQTLNQHNSDIMSLSLNESQSYLVSCAQDDNEILVSQQLENKEWVIVQKINQKGQRLCFINDNLLIIQPYLSSVMNIYELNNQTKLFNQIKELQVKNGNSCHCFFQSQYIKQKQILVFKNGFNVNLIQINQQSEFTLVQFIDFGTGTIFGKLTEDGQFMVSWDDKTQQIQIFQFNEI